VLALDAGRETHYKPLKPASRIQAEDVEDEEKDQQDPGDDILPDEVSVAI
jgi:hypothetical protein